MEALANMSIRDFLEEPLTTTPDTPLADVAGLLREHDVYEVFVPMEKRIGMVTLRSLLRVTRLGRTKVRNIIDYVPALQPSSLVREAVRIMGEYRLRALPVVEDGKVAGKASIARLVEAIMLSPSGRAPASKVMSPHPTCLVTKDAVAKARELMLRRRFDHIVVLDDRKVAGVVTSAHLVFSLVVPPDPDRLRVGVPEQRRWAQQLQGFMETPRVTVEVGTRLAGVAESMMKLKSSYALVQLGEELQGIVTYRDFLKPVESTFTEAGMPIYMVGLPPDPFEAEAAREKFMRAVQLMSRTVPRLEEARATIKLVHPSRTSKRYEVRVGLTSPRRSWRFAAVGYDLAEVFDEITSRIRLEAGRTKPTKFRPTRRNVVEE